MTQYVKARQMSQRQLANDVVLFQTGARPLGPLPPFPQVLCRGLHPKALLAKLGRIQRACGALMGARRGGGGRERLVGWLVRLGTNQARRRLVVTNLKDYGSCFSYRQRLTHARQRERRRRRRQR